MPDIVRKINPVTVVMAGIEFMQYGKHYLRAADSISSKPEDGWFDPLPYQLLCQSLELHLKAHIWLVDQHSRKTIKNKYGHNLEKLWNHSKDRGVARFCQPTPLRDETISLVGPYYKDRKFAYLDLLMSFEGIPSLRGAPKTLPTLRRMCHRLQSSLHRPVLRAS